MRMNIKKFAEKNPDAFLDDSLTGPDSGVKKEIDEIFNDLMRSLNQLSNINFVPKKLKKRSENKNSKCISYLT